MLYKVLYPFTFGEVAYKTGDVIDLGDPENANRLVSEAGSYAVQPTTTEALAAEAAWEATKAEARVVKAEAKAKAAEAAAKVAKAKAKAEAEKVKAKAEADKARELPVIHHDPIHWH